MNDERKKADEVAAQLDPYPHISAGAKVIRDVRHAGERFVIATRVDHFHFNQTMLFWYMQRAADGEEYGESMHRVHVGDEELDEMEARVRALIDRGFE